MPDGDHLFFVDSPQESPYEICKGDNLKKIIEEHSPSIPLSCPLLNAGVRPKDTMRGTPLYGAGFFMEGTWFKQVYLPHVGLKDRGGVLNMLRRNKQLHPIHHLTTCIINYYDHDGCVFVCLCCNLNGFSREPWFGRRDEVLDAVCKTMQLTESETAKAKGAFRWHMFDPICYTKIPKEFVIGI